MKKIDKSVFFLRVNRLNTLLFVMLLVIFNCIPFKESIFDPNSALSQLITLISFLNAQRTIATAGTAPSSLTYTGSPYTFTQNAVITTQTPTVTGSVAGCSAAPALSTGLTINNTNCAISGTPTVTQAATNHTITASNTNGDTTAVVNITVSAPCATVTSNWGTFTDCSNGTVSLAVTAGTYVGQTYTAQTLTWMKCSHGQTWNSSTNDCTGTGTSPTYGATTAQYCNANDSTCDNGTILNGTTSGAYTACNGLNSGAGTYGKTNWRVPTKNELRTLIQCADDTMPTDGGNCGPSNYTSPSVNNLFPNTQSGGYWSSSSYAPDTTAAWGVGFGNGVVDLADKTLSDYVRCVSGP